MRDIGDVKPQKLGSLGNLTSPCVKLSQPSVNVLHLQSYLNKLEEDQLIKTKKQAMKSNKENTLA